MADSWVVSRAYGRCIEGYRAACAAVERAHVAGDDAELLACLEDRTAWLRLMRETPVFVAPEVQHG